LSIDELVAGNVYKGNGAAQFFLIWTESGGAPVAKPTRKGFGSVILFDAAKLFGMDISVAYTGSAVDQTPA
jgi:two-component sensor histidine kinase